jgi:hypothetical protein
MVTDRLPDHATSLQGGELYIPVGIPAADDHIPLRDLFDEPQLTIQKYLEIMPFPSSEALFAKSPTHAHTVMLPVWVRA